MESSEEFPLDRLPMLVIGAISQYLSNLDIAACCAVSRGVRAAFDIELVWGSRYDKERVKYLQETPCKVQPGFVHPVTDKSGLRPISEWRVGFMIDNHLLNNWRQGKFTDEGVKAVDRDSLPSPGQIRWVCSATYHKFLTSDYVISVFRDVIKIVDVRNYPATLVVKPIPITLKSISYIVEANDMLLVLYNKGVEAYQLDFSSKQWNIKHAFVMDEPEKLSDDKKELVKKMFFRKDTNALFVVVEHFFVGYLKGNTTIHIWNFKTGVKLKQENSPIKNCTIEGIKSSNSNLVIVGKQQQNSSSSTSIFLTYNLLNLAFLPFKEFTNDHYEYCVFGNHFSIWADHKLQIYNYKTSKTVLCNYPLGTYQIQTLGNDIVFLEENELRLFNHATGEIQILMKNVSWFKVLNKQFIHIHFFATCATWEKVPYGSLESWGDDLERLSRRKVFEFIIPNTLRETSFSLRFFTSLGKSYLNKHATRYIEEYRSENRILHFW